MRILNKRPLLFLSCIFLASTTLCVSGGTHSPTSGTAVPNKEGRKEMFYLTTHYTHFIYGYMSLDIWLRTILIVRKKTRCRHIGYSFRITARVLLYAPSHRHTTAFVTPVVEHWLEREIVQWVHPMKDRSDDPLHHERTLLPQSYISLLSEQTHVNKSNLK